jgi:hypothetical protein
VRLLFLLKPKATAMRKILVFAVLAVVVSACSQYTCPTYSKSQPVEKPVAEKRV